VSKQTTNTQSETTPGDVATLEQTKNNLENEVAALERQIADTATELEAKAAKLAEARAAAESKLAEARNQIAAEEIERKAAEFLAVAARLDAAMTVDGMAAFRRLAAELSMAGRVRQAHHARESLIKRMCGQTVYQLPFANWAAMAAAWLIPAKEKAA
jgi:hypothetical protein